MILASACPLRIGAYTSLYPCGKTHISSSFWKKQACNLEQWLLTPNGSNRKCLLEARLHFFLIRSIGRAWALKNKKGFRLVFLLIFSYQIYCVIVSYIILTFLQTSKCLLSNGVIICISWLQCLSNRQFTLGVSVRRKLRKKDPSPHKF